MKSAILFPLETWAPTVRFVVNSALALTLGWLLAGLTWLVIEPAGAVSPSVPLQTTAIAGSAAASAPSTNLSILTRFSRFGRADLPKTFAPQAPTTNLDLVLKGVRTAPVNDDAERLQQAVALIQIPDGQVKVFRPGETIIERVTLNAVLADRVLILKEGELETLLMESNADGLAVLSEPGQDGLITGTPRTDKAPPSSVTTNNKVQNDSASEAYAMAGIDVSPVVEEGFTIGYRLDAGVAGPLLAQAGLSSTDIVTAVNGTPVTDTNPDQIIQQLKTSSSITLTVLRGGASQTVTLNLPNGAP